jgi:hypothetical protein
MGGPQLRVAAPIAVPLSLNAPARVAALAVAVG